jgi:hypothetical protein
LLLSALPTYLQRACPAAGVQLTTALVQALIYADDITLSAESAPGLASLLAATIEYLSAFGLQLSIPESTFWTSDPHCREFCYQEVTLTAAQQLTFLGFHLSTAGVTAAASLPAAAVRDTIEKTCATGQANTLRLVCKALQIYC